MTNLAIQSALVSAVPPFSAVPDSERTLLLKRLPCHVCPARAVIVGPGQNGCGLYILLSGKAKLTMGDAQGRQVTLAPVQRGGVLWKDTELFGTSTSTGGLTAIATEACEVLYMPKSEVDACITAHPRAGLLLLAELAHHLRNAYEKIASFAFDDVRGRVAQALLEYAKLDGDVWINAVGSEELARIVGASREMVSRVLKRMAEKGLIRRSGRTIVISAREKLLKACVHRAPYRDTHLRHAQSSATEGAATSALMP